MGRAGWPAETERSSYISQTHFSAAIWLKTLVTYPRSAIAVCSEADGTVVDGSVGPHAAASVASGSTAGKDVAGDSSTTNDKFTGGKGESRKGNGNLTPHEFMQWKDLQPAGARASAFPETSALATGLDHTVAQAEATDAAMLGVGVAEAARLACGEPDSGTSSTAATEHEPGTSSAAAIDRTSWHPRGPAASVVAAAEGVAQTSSHF